MSPLFACVQELLQISIFSLSGYRGCSLLFARVGVKLVSEPRRLHWRDASAEFFKGPGTALSPGHQRRGAEVERGMNLGFRISQCGSVRFKSMRSNKRRVASAPISRRG